VGERLVAGVTATVGGLGGGNRWLAGTSNPLTRSTDCTANSTLSSLVASPPLDWEEVPKVSPEKNEEDAKAKAVAFPNNATFPPKRNSKSGLRIYARARASFTGFIVFQGKAWEGYAKFHQPVFSF
jgi:hypothetical protein